MNTRLTVGGIALGLAILTWYLVPWWRAQKNAKSKDWKSLIPLGFGIMLGILAASCAGGLFGTIAGWTQSAANAAGGAAISSATGSAAPAVATVGIPALTPGGALLVIACFVAAAALWKKVPETSRKAGVLGSVVGLTLGMSAGAAGAVALALIPAMNSMGNGLLGAI
ncbi:hypothetical protein ACWGDX_24100 [Streptomyces sp. NPDC055025]